MLTISDRVLKDCFVCLTFCGNFLAHTMPGTRKKQKLPEMLAIQTPPESPNPKRSVINEPQSEPRRRKQPKKNRRSSMPTQPNFGQGATNQDDVVAQYEALGEEQDREQQESVPPQTSFQTSSDNTNTTINSMVKMMEQLILHLRQLISQQVPIVLKEFLWQILMEMGI